MNAVNLSPMDAFRWFQAPNFGSVSITQNKSTLVLARDPQRVGVILGSTAGAAALFGPDSSVSGTKGMPLSSTTPYLMFTQADWGNLVQGEWWCFTGSLGVSVYYIEIRVIDWPTYNGSKNGSVQASASQPGKRRL